jgi:hypothetical protein
MFSDKEASILKKAAATGKTLTLHGYFEIPTIHDRKRNASPLVLSTADLVLVGFDQAKWPNFFPTEQSLMEQDREITNFSLAGEHPPPHP